MPLTVISVAYPLTPVGPDAVGGSEQILTLIDSALVRAGHRSIVVACEGSDPQGTLVPTPKWDGDLTEEVRSWAQEHHRIAIAEALRRWDADIVHMHSLDFYAYMPAGDVPVLATLHLPPSWYPSEVFHFQRSNWFVNCVSRSEAEACPPGARTLPPIENGVDIDRLTANLRKCDYALALGRICPEKGLHLALEAAERAGMPMLLAGEVFKYESHVEYFNSEIMPRLSETRRFIGAAGLRAKRRLMTKARCLLVPSLVSETSSLVAMESMACGTPVIAFPNGALPEIVEHGVTGFIVNSVDEMTTALRAVRELDPEACRRAARERFSAERMTSRYLRLYEELIRRCMLARNTKKELTARVSSIWELQAEQPPA